MLTSLLLQKQEKNSLIMWGHMDLDRKIRLTSMVWYRKYQLSYIIALWSQQWKICVSSGSLLLLLHLVNYFTRGRGHLARRVLTLADDSCRRCGKVTSLLSPMKFSSYVSKNFVFPWFAREKERTTPVFQNSLFIGQFTDCFITARGKSKIETTGVSVKWIPINKEFVGSFF